MSLLLGIDEGTSAVKAVLFDTDLKPVREARREKPLDHPKPGWVEQDPEVIVSAVVDAAEPGAEVAVRDPPLERLGLPLRLAQQRSQLLHDSSEFGLGGLTLVRGWA